MPIACLQVILQFDLNKMTLTFDLGQNYKLPNCSPVCEKRFKILNIEI
jgi:hypothetical protein